MFSALLVDDERNVLDTLLTDVDWNELGFDVPQTAANGQDALDRMTQNAVDLLVTDIRMPEMDGLTLLTAVRSRWPHTRCVILTAYDEFDYVHRALKLGIENFILKPLEIEEMTATVKRIVETLQQPSIQDESLIFQNVLFRWLSGTISDDALAERAAAIKINLYLRFYAAVVFKCADGLPPTVRFKPLRDRLRQEYAAYYLLDNNGNYVLIIGMNQVDPTHLTEMIRAHLETEMADIPCMAAVGEAVSGFAHLSESYQTALRLAQYPFRSGRILAESSSPYKSLRDQLSEEIFILLQETDETAFEAKLRTVISDTICPQIHHPADGVRILDYCASVLCTYLTGQCAAGDTETDEIRRMTPHFPSCPGANDLFYILQRMFRMTRSALVKKSTQFSPIVRLAVREMSENLEVPFSIKAFCASHDITPPYFGLLFKKETGFFVNDYHIFLRINYAICLLKTTNRTIAEISTQLMFSTPSYFIQTFKKQTGMSPNKYRQLYCAN